jgi:hypothetical protein
MRICLILLLAGLAGCAGESLKGRDFIAETDADVAAPHQNFSFEKRLGRAARGLAQFKP